MRIRHLGAPALIFALACARPDAALSPADFAARMRLETRGDAPAYELRLPEDVYLQSRDRELGDLRVFDARGAVVPHALHPAAPEPDIAARTLGLRFVALPADAAARRDLAALAEFDRHGRLQALDVPPEPEREASAYLIDASGLAGPLVRLQLRHAPRTREFHQLASVEASDDLRRWRSVVESVPVSLRRSGSRVLRRDGIDLPPTSEPYLRLVLRGEGGLPPLAGVRGREAQGAEAFARRWLAVPVRPDAESPGRYRFELPPALRVRGLRIRATAPEVLARVRVRVFLEQHWHGPGPAPELWTSRWYTLSEGTSVYRYLDPLGEVRNPPLEVTGEGRTRWRLEVTEGGEAFAPGPPGVAVGWIPHLLVFDARGPGPWTLAYGSDQVTSTGLSTEQVLAGAGLRAEARPGSLGLARAEPRGRGLLAWLRGLAPW